MQNGHLNGAGHPQPIQVNPQQAAAFGLQFLERVSHTRAEREHFDVAVALLNAIATGQLILAQPPQPQLAPAANADPPPP